jgi:hypothetical protein
MGEEIGAQGFSDADRARFSARLRQETALLRRRVESKALSQGGHMLGFEIEAWILDHNYFPAPINVAILDALRHPLATPELSRFNLELNSEPLPLVGGALDRAADALTQLWRHCNDAAHRLDANMVMIGTLPTLRDEDLTLANMSPLNRYAALTQEAMRLRRGAPLRLDIAGRDHLVSEHSDLMLEAATTSFQIHLKAPADLAHLYYNASIALSGPLLAACGNAPFLFGRALWAETRIPVFEQAVVLPGPPRVTFGAGYVSETCIELFEENERDYAPLLPMRFDDASPESFRHLKLHNGVIWRWTRPLVGADADGTPHFRIEHRILPAGPTIVDMIANTALYLGLARHLALAGKTGTGGLAFDAAKRNFYAAAQHGLDAELFWPGIGVRPAPRLLLETLIPMARAGLADLGVSDSSGWLDLIAARVESGQTGAVWQRCALKACEGDRFALMAAYCERQRSGAPAHQWEI